MGYRKFFYKKLRHRKNRKRSFFMKRILAIAEAKEGRHFYSHYIHLP